MYVYMYMHMALDCGGGTSSETFVRCATRAGRKHRGLAYKLRVSEGVMTRLESLIELKYLNSSFSSLSSY